MWDAYSFSISFVCVSRCQLSELETELHKFSHPCFGATLSPDRRRQLLVAVSPTGNIQSIYMSICDRHSCIVQVFYASMPCITRTNGVQPMLVRFNEAESFLSATHFPGWIYAAKWATNSRPVERIEWRHWYRSRYVANVSPYCLCAPSTPLRYSN